MKCSVHFSSIPCTHTHINPQTLSLKGYIKRVCKLYIIHISSFQCTFMDNQKKVTFCYDQFAISFEICQSFLSACKYKQYIKKSFSFSHKKCITDNIIIEKSCSGRYLWKRNWDFGWIWASWHYWKKKILANYEQLIRPVF